MRNTSLPKSIGFADYKPECGRERKRDGKGISQIPQVEKEYYQSLEEMEGDADLRRETENSAF